MTWRRALFCLMLLVFPIVSAQATSQSSKPSAFDYQPQSEDERGLWMQMNDQEREIKASKFLITDSALNQYIRSILCRTVGQSRCVATRIYLMRTPYFNASMAPNGMLVVWSGLLLRARNEAELASVLAHEFNHFEQQHSLQSFRDIRAKSDALTWLSFIPALGAVSQMGIVGSVFQFNRDMEKQADLLALQDLVRSGYDPMASANIWAELRAEMDATAAARHKKSEKDDGDSFFSTHPSNSDRMAYLKAAAEKAHDAKSYLGAAAYRKAMQSWLPLLFDDQIKLNDFGATDFLLKQLAHKGWSDDLLYARGELYRARGKSGDFASAAVYYRQSIAKGSNIAENWRGLGLALLRLDKPVEARAMLQIYLNKAPIAADRDLIAMMVKAP